MNQPARSISDLGAAMWLGLPPSDRLKAQVNRGLAYRAAGLSEQGEAELAAAKKANSEEIARLIAEDGGASSNNTADRRLLDRGPRRRCRPFERGFERVPARASPAR